MAAPAAAATVTRRPPKPPPSRRLTDSEKAALNFTLTGTWTYDTGYGYTVTIGDYTTKTDYDKASARQVFYAQITANGATSDLIQFQGKDTAFRKEIAADYEDFEIRDAAFVFSMCRPAPTTTPTPPTCIWRRTAPMP